MTLCDRQLRTAPRPAGLLDEAVGAPVVVAESVRDNGEGSSRSRCSDGGTAGGCDRDTDPAHERGKVAGTGRLGKSQRGA